MLGQRFYTVCWDNGSTLDGREAVAARRVGRKELVFKAHTSGYGAIQVVQLQESNGPDRQRFRIHRAFTI